MSISLAYKLFLSLIKANIIYIPKSYLKINLFMTYYTYVWSAHYHIYAHIR